MSADHLGDDAVFNLGVLLNRVANRARSIDLYATDADQQLDAVDKELSALEARVAAAQASSLKGAAVQLMLAHSLMTVSMVSQPDQERRQRVAALVRSALVAVADATDIDLRAVGGEFYAPDIR